MISCVVPPWLWRVMMVGASVSRGARLDLAVRSLTGFATAACPMNGRKCRSDDSRLSRAREREEHAQAMMPACPAPLEPVRPKIPTPPGACDTHAHVFGPATRFPYAETPRYTPRDAPRDKALHMLDTLGFARGGLVQGSAHGRDNSAMLDALARHPRRLRGV